MTQRFRYITSLIKKDFTLDFRKQFAIGGIILYILSIVYIVYRSFGSLDDTAWNVLFWILLLFLSLNAILKSFTMENKSRELYYFTLVNPVDFLISKMIYSWILLLSLGAILILVFAFFLGMPVVEVKQFLIAFVLGTMGISICFSFVSSIAAKEQNGSTLMAILSLPVVIPILLILINLTSSAIVAMEDEGFLLNVALIAGINMIMLSVALLLFPPLWRS